MGGGCYGGMRRKGVVTKKYMKQLRPIGLVGEGSCLLGVNHAACVSATKALWAKVSAVARRAEQIAAVFLQRGGVQALFARATNGCAARFGSDGTGPPGRVGMHTALGEHKRRRAAAAPTPRPRAAGHPPHALCHSLPAASIFSIMYTGLLHLPQPPLPAGPAAAAPNLARAFAAADGLTCSAAGPAAEGLACCAAGPVAEAPGLSGGSLRTPGAVFGLPAVFATPVLASRDLSAVGSKESRDYVTWRETNSRDNMAWGETNTHDSLC